MDTHPSIQITNRLLPAILALPLTLMGSACDPEDMELDDPEAAVERDGELSIDAEPQQAQAVELADGITDVDDPRIPAEARTEMLSLAAEAGTTAATTYIECPDTIDVTIDWTGGNSTWPVSTSYRPVTSNAIDYVFPYFAVLQCFESSGMKVSQTLVGVTCTPGSTSGTYWFVCG